MQLPRFPVSGIPAQQRIDKLRGQLELAVTDGEAGAGPQQIPILGVQVHAAAQYLQGLLRCARLQRHGQYIAGAGVLRLQLPGSTQVLQCGVALLLPDKRQAQP